jgi:hypothetical protein
MGVPFSDDPIRISPPIPAPEVEGLAQTCARIIKAAHKGELWDVDAWKATARALGTKVLRLKTGDTGPGYYCAGSKTIFLHPKAEDWDLARRIVHELAHHVLLEYNLRPRRRPVERFDDNRQTLEHRIAQRVELLVMVIT